MKLVLALILCLCSRATTNAQNWPSFRGEKASGVAEGKKTPTSWNAEKSQNILWRATIPGFSHSSPIVWGNRVFVITAISSDASTSFNAKDRGIDLANDNVSPTWRIYSLDKKSGRVIWSQTAYEGLPRAKPHVKATQTNSTPVTDGKYCDVFVVRAGPKFELLATNAMSQALMATPAISDGRLILRTKDFVYAIGER